MKIRFQLLLAATLLIGTIPQANAEEVLDKGFGLLKIDAKIQALQKYLIATNADDLRSPDAKEMGDAGMINSGWLFDFTKAGMTNYHGLVVSRIEVYFGWSEKEEGVEDIFNFQVYLEKPKDDKTESAFTDALFDLYGDTMILQDENTRDVIGLSWFSSITLLSVYLGYDRETGEKTDYYVADFQQAYGG